MGEERRICVHEEPRAACARERFYLHASRHAQLGTRVQRRVGTKTSSEKIQHKVEKSVQQ